MLADPVSIHSILLLYLYKKFYCSLKIEHFKEIGHLARMFSLFDFSSSQLLLQTITSSK